MSKLCPYCKSKKVGSFNDEVAVCKVCSRVFGKSRLVDSTLFDIVTASQEALAEAVVYPDWAEYMGGDCWTSPFIGHYHTKEEAIKATLAELDKPGKKEESK